MYLTSTAIPADSTIDIRHAEPGVGGANVAPDLEWGDVPAGTKSFLVTCFDPDAPTGSGWWHWVVADIPAAVTALPEGGALPEGARTWPTDYGYPNWGGPWPPPGQPAHHYHFRVAALDVDRLEVPDDTTRANALLTASFHVLGEAEFVALFQNPAS
ncbi:MAG: YbhB/YbcL family Raf kinase inhibitor-like protein [Propionicimonas sp.]|uniref:YbhB/YbcL family Raf kinase inhibitor-like protein n=1 Tax=Propionicimonas sp. TaxID=1955623 RepID=UPI002B203193|nr:YbhB/YbcL family Raf kinase inhibitor-like protein [Propionicimonas sp.]MEA4945127.1 YbhB/YbcL family Raf kinase inhibitor-like protein [Propionicimonas sp.]MEA5117596.1 YbhB/YbcL family Raf kinase inhibitor-like protein [Propionicimonas sp.]